MRPAAIVAFITCFSASVFGGILMQTETPKNSLMAGAHSQDGTSKRSLERRFDNARFMFYNVETGLAGACGKLVSNSAFAVALNSAQYRAGSHCFQRINITAEGKSTTAEIFDECPGCGEFGLNLTPGLFDFFAPEIDGVIFGSWDFIDG